MSSTNPSENVSKGRQRQKRELDDSNSSHSSSDCSSVDHELGEIAITSDDEMNGFENI